MAAMYVESHGNGAQLVMIHGWGMHGGFWDGVVPQLAEQFTVHCVDLPGHGYSKTLSRLRERPQALINDRIKPMSPSGSVRLRPPRFALPTCGRGVGERVESLRCNKLIGTHTPSPPPLSRQRARGAKSIACLRFMDRRLEQLDAIVGALSAQFTGPLNVCGWSLGGLVALRWAQLAPLQVQRLVVVASTPCFAERKNWLFGVPAETLRQFTDDLERDHVAMLRRFLTLLVRGGTNERELLADLRSRLFCHGQPDINALRGGLEILGEVDFRAELPGITQPALFIAGECDKLTPPEASKYMAQALPNARLVKISDAAHVPFLSQPDFFVEQITDFLHG